MTRSSPAAMFVVPALLLGATLVPAPEARAASTRMTGRVIDADTQRPVPDAEIELVNTSGGQGYFRARANRRGEFAIDRIATERWYTLTVGAPGYADFVLGGWQFPAPERAVELVIPLDRAGVIETKLTRSDGKTPVAGAQVRVRSERGETWWEGYRPPPEPRFTNAQGVARFEGLTAGFWTVTAEVSGLRPAEVRRVAVRRGETTPVPIKMTRPASIAGFVRLADGSPVPGVVVTARGPAEAVGTSDLDGAFAIGELAPGRYHLELSHEGFEPASVREPNALGEGEAREGRVITVTPRPPELSFVLQREAFVPDEPVKIGFRSFRTSAVDLSLYEIPTAMLLDAAQDFRHFATGADTTGLKHVTSWQHSSSGAPWSWHEEEITVPPPVRPAAYVLRARAGRLERRVLFFVTDLGLLVKRSPELTLVSAASLRTGAPVTGANVLVIARPAAPPREGPNWAGALVERRNAAVVTNEQGLSTIRQTGTGQRLRVAAVSDRYGVAVVDAPLAPAAEQGGAKAFLYTDRPIYRPGHTVYWKLFARRATESGYAMPDATIATISIVGPDGTGFPVPSAKLSPHGTTDGAIGLANELALGDWTVTAKVGSASSTATFGLQEYRKPEFSVEVTPDRAVYVNGDEVRFRITAAYFFGAPVFGAAVRYTLFETRIDPPGGNPWDDWDEREMPRGGYGRVLKTGETRTDVDGKAEVAFTPERVAYDRRLTLEVEVVDASSRVVSGRGETIMGRGLFTLAVRPLSWMVTAGSPIAMVVETRDHLGKPVSAAVTVELDQDAWNPIERRTTRSSRPLGSATVTTDTSGRARLSLTPSPVKRGPLTIRARATDMKGNRITAESTVWAYDANVADYAYRYPALEAFADRERYQPGDTARILVNTDVNGALLLATIEGRELYERQAVTLAGHSGLLRFPIRREYAPNVFVSVHVRKGKEVHTRRLELEVAAERHDLAIRLEPNRGSYRPGEAGTIRVETRDAGGTPVPAELSVAVVDEAIFQLRPDRTPDPHEVFYGKRPNWVTTVVSFPVLYYGGAEKERQEEVRRNFKDVALWAPVVQTDAQGLAEVSLTWPDNLTTWRITSRGATDRTLVGKAVAKTLVTKDVVARLAGPRFFVAGDEAALVSVVTNRTDRPVVGVEQSLAATGPVSLSGPAHARTDLPPRGEGRAEWRLKVAPDLGPGDAPSVEAVFTFRAQSQADTDALEVRVPVRPRAVPLRSAGAGVLEQARENRTIALPSNLVRHGSTVTLDFSPSPAAMALAAIGFLTSYPYACTEQSANAVIPATALIAALRATDVTLPGWQEPARKLERPLERLAALQHGDGGWGWWESDDSDAFLTVLAMDALARAFRLGVAPPSSEPALTRGFGYLGRVFAEARTLDGEAYVVAHLLPLLAIEGADQRFTGLRERLEEVALALRSSPDQLSTSGLALATRVHAELGKAAEARTLFQALMKRAQEEGSTLHFPPDPGARDAWFGEDVENTAYALWALAAVEPRDARGPEIMRWLAARRQGLAWRSTRASGPVVVALAEWLAARPGEVKPDYKLRVQWNGETVLDRAVGPADVFGGEAMRVTLGGRAMNPGENRLAISREGTGSVSWSWEARAMVPSPGPPTPPASKLTVTREYLRAERTADRRGRPRYLAAPLGGEGFEVGASILVRLTLHATEELDYLMIEDPRIAGFEIEQLQPEGVERPWGLHAEERDDRAAFFIETLESGDTVIEYLIHPEIAGSFTALPTSASGMYDPDLAARSAEARLIVKPK